jgi:SSS family solute:Na+ symporter
MAFLGVLLGLIARVAFNNGMFAEAGYITGSEIDPEMGLPLLLRTILPYGLMGLLLSAYFSAILSTADSCLIAASGNIITDIIDKLIPGRLKERKVLFFSKVITLFIGLLALGIALKMEGVLQLMLLSYAVMVSGLLIPVLALLIFRKPDTYAALIAMIAGGTTTIILSLADIALPYGLAANIFGILLATILYITIHYLKQFKLLTT